MAAPPVPSSGAARNDRHPAEIAPLSTDNASYRDGVLVWDGSQLRDEDIITVTRANEEQVASKVGYHIWSLTTADSSSLPDSPPPFRLITHSASTLPRPFLDKHLFPGLSTHLDQKANILHVLISTLSGTGLAPQFFDDVLEPLLGAIGWKESEYRVVRTKSAESVKEFAQSQLLVEANNGKKQTVLMLSGDGGMVDTINGLLERGDRSRYILKMPSVLLIFDCELLTRTQYSAYTKPVLSQLPLGTGNALFHSLHKTSTLPSLYIQGLRTLLRGTPRPLPIFRATFSPGARALTNEAQTQTPLHNDTLYGAVVASYGLHATLVADSDTTEYRKHGAQRFALVAKDLLDPPEGGDPHAYRAEVTLTRSDEKEHVIARKEHGYVLAALVSNLEKTFTISPASKPLDGQLRVVHFGPLDGQKTMRIMTEAYNNGNHISMDAVGYERVQGMQIKFLEEGQDWKWRRCCVDGLIVGVEPGGWMDVRKVEGGIEPVEVVIDM
jgi:diacylglycerol kinase family enzyme